MTDRHTLLRQARDAERRGDEVGLERALRQLIAASPDDPVLRVRLGGALFAKEDWSGAYEHLEAARSLGTDEPSILGIWSVAARHIGRVGEVVKVMRAAAKVRQSASLLLLLSDALFELGMDEECRRVLEAALELEPDNEEILYNLAVAQKAVEPEAGLDLLDRAISIDPEYGEAHRERAYCLMVTGSWSEAESALQRALELNGQDMWSLIYRSLLAMRQGLLEDAEHDLRLAKSRAEIPTVHWLLGDLHMAPGDTTSARGQYELAVRLSPYDLEGLRRFRDADGYDENYWAELLRAMETDDRMLRTLSMQSP